MKLWVDDVRQAPAGYFWVQSVNDAQNFIEKRENRIQSMMDSAATFREQGDYTSADNVDACIQKVRIELIDIDHDAGDFADQGGDYIKLLDWLEETGRNYPIRIHSMNPVGVQNMRAVIQKNGWKEIR